MREVQERGAGEIVLNCMDSDGVREGYDLEQLATVRARCHVPLVASGGAGSREHFREVFGIGVDAALAASVFHSGVIQDRGPQTLPAARGGVGSATMKTRKIWTQLGVGTRAQGLLPVIIQHADNGTVLMTAYREPRGS